MQSVYFESTLESSESISGSMTDMRVRFLRV
jgi:hypothetical protein